MRNAVRLLFVVAVLGGWSDALRTTTMTAGPGMNVRGPSTGAAASWAGRRPWAVPSARVGPLSMSSVPPASSATGGGQRPDLVDQAAFVAAIECVEAQIAQLEQQQQQRQEEEDPDGEDRYDGSETRLTSAPDETVYAMGRLFVQLPVDRQPELDLTESVGPLVLVTAVYGETAAQTGLQVYDTIVGVTVDTPATGNSGGGGDGVATTPFATTTTTTTTTTFRASTRQMTLEQTAAVLTAAARHALENGQREVTLELNRLIRGYYAPSSADR